MTGNSVRGDRIQAKVAKVIDGFRVVINKGGLDGVKIGDYYKIISCVGEITDPDGRGSLGKLEIPKGRGRIIHVQENMSLLESNTPEAPRKIMLKQKSWFGNVVEEVVTPNIKSFDSPERGDLVLED